MRITVSQLHDDAAAFERDWANLVDHVQRERSDLVLLPEMPGYPWFADKSDFSAQVWQEAVAAHEKLMGRLEALAPATVLGTRPVNSEQQRLNQAFLWTREQGELPVHAKCFFPDEPGFYEAKWFDAPRREFLLVEDPDLNLKLGFLICTELMFNEWARRYGRHGAHIIAVPRGSELSSVERWLIALRMAAIVSGAYVLSSNRCGTGPSGVTFGGAGAIVSPEGEVLVVTSREQPFVTLDVSLERAEAAKLTYPRYVREV